MNTKAYKDAMAPYGTGGDYQRVAQAVTAALQGLAGGNINGAIAGAAAPYVANTIKQVLGDNDTARVMAHAVLGVVVAHAQGNSAGAGAAGAVTGELMAGVIIKQLYGDVEPQDLTEEQKQKVSALSTLASGLARAVVGGDAANAVAGAESGKNAVENNFLGDESKAERDKAREALLQNSYTTETARKLVMSERADQLSDELLEKYRISPSEMTPEEFQTLSVFLQIYLAEQIKVHGAEKGQLALAQLLLQGSTPTGDYPYAGTTQAKDEFREANGYSDWLNARDPSDNERIYQQALGIIRAGSAQEGMAAVGDPALYLLGGGLGATIRTVAAANGAFQLGVGAGQASEGDYWNAAGNMLSGLLGVATLDVPGAKVPVLKDFGAKESAGGASSVQQISGGNIRHINGALGEAHGWKNALDSGHVPVKAPGKVTAPGVDFVTFDPKSGRVVLWDSKYRGPGGSYPSSIPESKLKSWTAEARAAVVQMPEGAMKNRILESLDKGKVDAKIFRWPQ